MNTTPTQLTNVKLFVRGLNRIDRVREQAEIDEGNRRIDKEEALMSATRILNHLVKRANQNGKPHALIVKALRTQLGIVRELDALRGQK